MKNLALEKAKSLLSAEGYTCVLTDGTALYTSTRRGVKPLVDFLQTETDFNGFFAADKVVGRATAYLYVLLGVKELYAQVISQPAAAVLQANGISIEYDTLVPNIINRAGDGICPFEQAVMTIADPRNAYAAILEKMEQMGIR